MIERMQSGAAMERSDTIQQTRVATGLGFDALVRAFEHELKHLDPAITQRLIERKATWSEVEREMAGIASPHGLMIIARVDQGGLTSLSGREKRCSLYLVGNPVIANDIIGVDRRASFYVPFRVALYEDEGLEGAVIAYDRPSSFLATLGHAELTKVGQSLDRKIDAVVSALRTR